jgi:hypothetical protein
LTTSTLAPASAAPEASVISPVIEPETDWAYKEKESCNSSEDIRSHVARYFITILLDRDQAAQFAGSNFDNDNVGNPADKLW